MKSRPLSSVEINPYGFAPDSSSPGRHGLKQRGVVLFFTLVALLAMSLAAVALIRSVDTSALISGNLAYKQTAITSADRGIELAMAKLASMNASLVDIDMDASHPLNQTDLAANPGYYSSFNPVPPITDSYWWSVANGSVTDPDKDESGNTVSYIIQRMCRTANVNKLEADCIVGPDSDDGSQKGVNNATQEGSPPQEGKPAVTRITVKTTGPRGSTSYVQSFVY